MGHIISTKLFELNEVNNEVSIVAVLHSLIYNIVLNNYKNKDVLCEVVVISY